MAKLRKTRLPILIAWIAVLGVLAYLSTHPRLVAPFASRLISRNLMQEIGGNIRVGEYNFRYLQGVDLYRVSATFPGKDGGLTIVAIDTLSIDYSLKEMLGRKHHLHQVRVHDAEVYVHLADRGTADGESDGMLDVEWPWLQIDLLQIINSSIAVSGSNGRIIENIPDLNWRGEVRSGSVLQLACRNADIDWASHNSHLHGLHGDLIIDREGIRTPSLGGWVNESQVDVVGERRWDGSLDLQVSGRNAKVVEVEDLIDMTIGFSAAGDIDATFVTHGDSLLFAGTFSGDLEGYQIEGFEGRATIAPGWVHFPEMSGRINSAWFSGTADFDVTDPFAVTFTLTGDVADVDLSEGLVLGEDDLPASDGHGRLTIFHSDEPFLTRVTGVMYDGHIEVIPFDTCLVDVVSTEQELVFNQIELQYEQLFAVLTGAADSTRYFDGALSVSVEDLATVPPGWGWPLLAGRLYGEGTVRGFEQAMGFAGRLEVHDFFLDPIGAEFSDVALVAGNILGDAHFSADIKGTGFTLGQAPLGDYALVGSVSGTGAEVDVFRTVLGDSTLYCTGRAAFTDSISDFIVEDFLIELEGNTWSLTEEISFVAGAGRFTLPALRLESASGALAVEGNYVADTIVEGSLQLERCNLGLINPFLPAGSTLSGEATADVLIGGTPDAPVINLTASVTNSYFELAHIDSLHVAGCYADDRMDVNRFHIETNHGSARGSGSIDNPGVSLLEFWPGAELDLDLVVPQADWAFVDQFQLPALERIAGTFSAGIQVGGNTADPVVEAEIVSEPFNIHWLHLDRLDGHLHADADQLVLSDLRGNQDDLAMTGRIEVPLQFDLLSEPVSPEDGPFFMQLTIPENSDLTPLSDATNAFVETSGRGHGEVLITGPLNHPFYQGNLKIEDGGFVIRGLEEVYRECSTDGVFSGNVLSVRNIRGREGLRGTFAGEGEVVFDGLFLKTFRIDLALDRFLVASIPDLRAIVRADHAMLTGVKVGPDSLLVPEFTGDVEVLKARYTGDFSEKPGAVDVRIGNVAPDWLADIHVYGAPRTSWIANAAMELELGGDVTLIRDLDGMYMRGTLDVDAGRIPVFNNDFKVVRGNLDFSREIGLEPRIDLDAETRVRVQTRFQGTSIVERITVHAAGSIYEPEITFLSDSGFSREGIERMLLGLSPYSEDEELFGRLTNTSIRAGFNLLEREIAGGKELFDTIEIDQIQREQSDGTMALDPLIGVGKYLSQDLYIKYAQGLSQEDRDILVEYQISDHLLLQSEIRRRLDEYDGQDTYNLDLKYRFEY